ncbi:hypothetical protein H1R20_g14053, partial [Candolleomyces eurysporus]
MLAPSGAPHLKTRIKRATKGLRRLRAANAGDYKAFESVLDVAYGRKGKLKWELLEPVLNDPNAPLPPRIIPQVENSRPPVYSKPLVALLTHAQSMATRPLRKDAWTSAKLLPARADPCSEEAHIFGPFSKRREYNMQWKFFRTEKAKVLPPLEATVAPALQDGAVNPGNSGPRPLAFQNLGVLTDIERLVGTAVPPPLTRKERKAAKASAAKVDANSDPSRPPRHPSRWVRRRYRALLAKVPVLTYTPKPGQTEEGSYSVRLSDRAAGQAAASNITLREIDDVNLAWLQLGMEENTSNKNKTQKPKDKTSKNDSNAGEGVRD